jgi:diguanylate cyclase (GGDEF)-like protein
MKSGPIILRLLSILMLVCSFTSAFADTALPQPATILAGEVTYDPIENNRYIKEPEFPWSVEYVLNNLDTLDWKKSDRRQAIGRTSDIYWFVLNIKNLDQSPSIVAARFIQYRAHGFDAYLIRDGELLESYRGGLSESLDGSPFSSLNTLHMVLEQDRDYQVLYRIDAREYLQAHHFVLRGAYEWQESLYNVYIPLGIFCGVMFFIALCNLCAFVVLKDNLYLVTFSFAVLMTTYIMSYYAAGIRYWFIDTPAYNSHIIFFSYHFAVILEIIFAILFLNTRRNSPRLHRFLVFTVFVLIAIYGLAYELPLGLAAWISEGATVLLLPFLLTAAFIALKNKQGYALLYIVSKAVITLYFLAVVFAGIFYPDYLSDILKLLFYVILIQMIFLSLAQVNRVRSLDLKMKQATIISMTDELTGMPNRRAFDQNLITALVQSKDSGESVSCLMIDIDFFKKYNDTLGHVAGDECLKKVAASIASSLNRSEDTAARYGGEEFCVVMPGASYAVAERVAANIINELRQLAIPHPKSSVSNSITLSIGVMSVIADEHTQPAAMVEMADKQLYMAKDAGRDRYYSRSVAGSVSLN